MRVHAQEGIPPCKKAYTTIFKSFDKLHPQKMSYGDIFQYVKSDKLNKATAQVQAFPYGSTGYKKTKRTCLPFFSPHCQTIGLKKKDAAHHSGVFCFDIDKKDNPALDFERLKEILGKEQSLLGYFSSVGGGLKVFFRVRSSLESHQADYDKVLAWIEKLSGANFDKSQGGLSQLCFLSYDPKAYYHPWAKPLCFEAKTPFKEKREVAKAIKKHPLHALREEASLIRIFYQLERKGRSITASYDDWIKVGFALINSMKAEKAREWFHRFSSLDSCYNFEEAEQKYESLQKSSLSYRAKGKLSIASIMYMARQQGCQGEEKPASPFNLNHAHPLQFAMPSRYSSTQVLQAKIIYTIAWLENNPQNTYKQGAYVRINQSFIAGIVGSSQQSISNNIRKLKEAGFLELIQPQIGEGDSSYFAKASKKYYQAILASSKLKNIQSLENEGLQESCLNEPTGGEGECKGGNTGEFLSKKEKKREEQKAKGEKRPKIGISVQNSLCNTKAPPSKEEKNGGGLTDTLQTKAKKKTKASQKTESKQVRKDYQLFQEELEKLSGYRKDSKQIQEEFVRVYENLAPILKYLPIFLKKVPQKDIFWYLHDRKWIQYAKSRPKVPIPRTAKEARNLNERYKIADLVRKHKHLDCIILDGRNKYPERVPEGIPYMLGLGRYFVNDAGGVREEWDP